MSSFITAIVGIMAIFVSLFCAFGTGVDMAKQNREHAGVAMLSALIFALIGIALLLVRS